jgi:hypothetical protein
MKFRAAIILFTAVSSTTGKMTKTIFTIYRLSFFLLFAEFFTIFIDALQITKPVKSHFQLSFVSRNR